MGHDTYLREVATAVTQLADAFDRIATTVEHVHDVGRIRDERESHDRSNRVTVTRADRVLLVKEFADERLVRAEPSQGVPVVNAYRAYVDWCVEHLLDPTEVMTYTGFTIALTRELGFTRSADPITWLRNHPPAYSLMGVGVRAVPKSTGHDGKL